MLTDKSERFFAAELVREAVIAHTQQELPYAAAVVIDEFSDEGKLVPHRGDDHRREGVAKADRDRQGRPAAERDRHRARGSSSKQLLERKVFLKLWVRVAPDWTDRPEQVRELLAKDAAPVEVELRWRARNEGAPCRW